MYMYVQVAPLGHMSSLEKVAMFAQAFYFGIQRDTVSLGMQYPSHKAQCNCVWAIECCSSFADCRVLLLNVRRDSRQGYDPAVQARGLRADADSTRATRPESQ